MFGIKSNLKHVKIQMLESGLAPWTQKMWLLMNKRYEIQGTRDSVLKRHLLPTDQNI